jgi:cyclopropane-fatty-acyl-phospholipid synthase
VQGFEVRDMECLREHYALTLQHWARRLESNRKEATHLVGAEKYRLWLGYLAGVSFGFLDGNLSICQTVAVKRQTKGPSGLPMTREDLYR